MRLNCPKNCSHIKELEIKPKEKDIKIGFYAKSWLKVKGECKTLVASFRGTDSVWKDFFKGNFVFFPHPIGGTQFDAALDFVDRTIKDTISYDKIIFTGHSLGGGLAQYAQRFYKNSKAIVFDSSPNKGRIYSLFSKKYDPNTVRVYEKGEILELPRKLLDADRKWDWTPNKTGKSTIWMDFFSDGALDGHNMSDLAMSLVRVAASAGDKEALNVIKSLEDKRNPCNLPELKCPGNLYRKALRN